MLKLLFYPLSRSTSVAAWLPLFGFHFTLRSKESSSIAHTQKCFLLLIGKPYMSLNNFEYIVEYFQFFSDTVR